jgi:DNA-binding Lrp family transcriptional regulator
MKNNPSQELADSRGSSNDGFPRWTFLTNHAHVLAILNAEPEIVLRQVAARVGITERAVQRIIHELEEEGFIKRERIGRRNRYGVLKAVPLRHPIESHRTIGDLLELISVK